MEKSKTGISSLANWVALCMKKWSRAEGAIISADKLKGDISKGPISKKDIYGLLDYNIHIVYLKLRGDSLQTIISSNLDKGLGLAGIALSMKNNAVNEIRIRDKQLNPAKIYQIVVPDYMLNEEEYAILPHAVEFVNKPQSIIEILNWQLRRNKSPITGHTQDTNNNR
ncbi:MAG: 5'-nucleotidase C-terminal domain-containing protein [Elusimicrobia bacterium]|nr:5'-nucleotidase C-terminal domain-containing protein [Elusimicrobiota bacterium]